MGANSGNTNKNNLRTNKKTTKSIKTKIGKKNNCIYTSIKGNYTQDDMDGKRLAKERN